MSDLPTYFHFDSEKMLTLCSPEVYKAGLLYFKQDRVIEHYVAQGCLYGSVEGSEDDSIFDVELRYREQDPAAGHGNKLLLASKCDCLSNLYGEPHQGAMLCKHAIAALLAYADSEKNAEVIGSARDTAIRDRIKRGHTEVLVQHIDGAANFGTWQAMTLANTPFSQQYTVTIRSQVERVNYCTCPDFANNQLATCKHVEAVLHQLSKDPSQFSRQPPLPFVYRSFDVDGQIRIQRTGGMSESLIPLIDRYFDPQGQFKGELPADFFAFSDSVFGNSDIMIGEDAKLAVRKMLDQQAHQLKSMKIHQQVMASDGVLPGVRATLYPYQLEGIAFLAANGRGLLADDMGLGKTIQAIAAASWLTTQADVKRVLVVCPASLKQQWAREIEKFTGHDTQIIQGGAEQRHAQYTQQKTFFIANYELVLRDATVINEVLAPDLLILDEAQRIKNWRTKLANAVKSINSQYAFVLTGTPLENRLEDLYSLMQVVDQEVLGPLWRYLSEYHITDDKGKIQGYRNLTDLRRKIKGSMLRRNRSIVAAQLPARTTLRLDVPMTKKQYELHDSALSAAAYFATLAKKRPLTPAESNKLMSSLQQARMACDAAGLVDKETQGSPKLNELRTLIEELCVDNGLKMVVFSQWRGMTTMVEEMLRHIGVGFVHLHGGVPSQKRGALMDKFREDDAVRVFISTDAGGSGLNLQSASVLVNLDMPWNPAVLEQRNARVHRLGQPNHVQIILMIAEDSYEQRVYQLINNKQDLFDNVIDPEGTEDIVGVSKKALNAVMDDLATAEKSSTTDELIAADPAETEIPAPLVVKEAVEELPTQRAQAIVLPPMLRSEEDSQIKQGLLKIQQYFGERIEQVMAKGGGLLIILSRLKASDNGFIDELDLDIPVATIDLKTLRQLQNLGIDPITANAQEIDLPPVDAIGFSHWYVMARHEMDTARLMLKIQDHTEVMAQLCLAIAAVLTEKAQLTQLMTVENVPVWLYSQAVPEEQVTVEQAYTISRVMGLRQATAIPTNLLQQSFEDVEELVAELIAAK